VDVLDRQILAELQADGRLTVTELANRVGLSVSPCHRRLEVVVLITMRRGDSPTVEEFERLLAQIRNVTSAQRLFGEPDYVLHVFCTDIADYQRLWDEQLGTLPGVARFNSMMVMKQIVVDRPPPVTPASSA
jgi:DNA-binding Lrp family transcriptional regulator